MSIFDDPFHPDTQLRGCTCGHHNSQAEHDQAKVATLSSEDHYLARVIESAVVRSLFPEDDKRRAFMRAIGGATALSAISGFFPLGAATALAAEPIGALEKKQVNVGFLPITCSTPILLGQVLGLYEKQGLQVKLHKAAGWAGIRDKSLSGEFDAAHMLAPMALGLRLGLSANPAPLVTPLFENLNGSSLVLASKHKGSRDPKAWKGFKFAVPFELSIQNFLLREHLLASGLDPEKDVKISPMPPPEMLAGLRSGAIDGFFGAEPFGQRAVQDGIGFIHLISAELWDGHPCCTFTTSESLLKEAPNTFAALFRAIIQATIFTEKVENMPKVTTALSAPEFLNQPVAVIEQVLTGRYADGLGNNKVATRRVAFEPFPWQSIGVWILHEMKRWGYIKKDADFKQVAESVFLATDARKHMIDAGVRPAKVNSRKHVILGSEFDPDKPDVYFRALPAVKS